MDLIPFLTRDIVENPLALRAALGDAMRAHTALSYEAARKVLYATGSHNIYGEDEPAVYKNLKDAYLCGCTAEHIVPRSLFGGDVAPMYTDLHNLYPAPWALNGARSNYRFCELERAELPYGVEVDTAARAFEPANVSKGNIARAIAYFCAVYPGAVALADAIDPDAMLIWNYIDPVDGVERARNAVIYNFQGNRNLFIDFSDLVFFAHLDVFGGRGEIALAVDGSPVALSCRDVVARRNRFCESLGVRAPPPPMSPPLLPGEARQAAIDAVGAAARALKMAETKMDEAIAALRRAAEDESKITGTQES